MSNKSKIVSIPLTGDLNLSTNKLDVIAPGDSGYLHNDAHIYGNILSPVYRKKTTYDYEWYDTKTGDHYNIGSSYVTRNGSSVLSFQRTKFVQAKIDKDGLFCYDNGRYVRQHSTSAFYINLYSASDDPVSFPFVNQSPAQEHTAWNITNILAARVPFNGRAFILYQSGSTYYYSVWDQDGQISAVNMNTDYNWTAVNAPMITFKEFGYHSNSDWFTSVFSDSGERFDGDVATFVYKNGNLYPASIKPTQTGTTTETVSTAYRVRDIFDTKTSGTVYYPKRIPPEVLQSFALRINGNAALVPKITLYYVPCFTIAGTEVLPNTFDNIVQKNCSSFPISEDTRFEDGNITYDEFTSSIQTDTLYKVGSTNIKNGTVSVDSIWAVNASLTGGYAPLPWMDMQYNDKRAMGFFVIDIEYTSNNTTVHKKFKLFPGQNSENIWDNAWSNVKLYSYTGSSEVTDSEDASYINITTTETITVQPTRNPNAVLDNGTLICTQLPGMKVEDSHETEYFAKGSFAFTGNYNHYLWDEGDQRATIYYDPVQNSTVYLGMTEDAIHAYPYKLVTKVCSLGKNYFRYSLITKGFGEEKTLEDGTVESPDTTVLTYDSGFNKVFINAGYNESSKTLAKGSVSEINGWRILYNNNVVSNISYSPDPDVVGTILMDWDYIDEVLEHSSSGITVKDTFGNIIRFTTEDWTDAIAPYTIVNDRFIIINTVSYDNCYDMKLHKKFHFASDYNNRWMNGYIVQGYLAQSDTNDYIFSQNTVLPNFIDGSAQNANYQITNLPVGSVKYAPEITSNVWLNETPIVLKGYASDIGIEIYYDIGTTTAGYHTSVLRGAYIKDTNLESAYFTNDVVYNPNIFTRFISSYMNQPMIINDSTNTAYPLNKYNGIVFLNYFLQNGLENAKDIFVVQTLSYFISEDYIFEIYYNMGNVENFTVVSNIKGMEYIGCLPSSAIFYSPKDKSFWAFQGDAILRKIIQATDIEEIKGQWYDTSNQYLYIATDKGLLCLNETINFLIKDLKNVSAMWFFDDKMIVKNTETHWDPEEEEYVTETKDWELSFKKPSDVDTDYNIETKWFGSIENLKMRVDCLYFRLMNPGSNVTPKFVIKTTTMTDMSVDSDTKSVQPTFDTITDAAYIRLQPRFQTCVAMKVSITSNCPLISWSIGYQPLDEAGQLSTINI